MSLPCSPADTLASKARPPLSGWLRLAPLARLSEDGASLELGSAERVQLSDTAAALLARCDGTSTAEDLARHSGNPDATMEFLSVALEMHWIVAHAERRR